MFFAQSVRRNCQMLSNKELTLKEFHVANNIKRAMLHVDDDKEYAKTFLIAALKTLHR
jgi:hypothetical protein